MEVVRKLKSSSMKKIYTISLIIMLAAISCTNHESTNADQYQIYLQVNSEDNSSPALKSPYISEIPSINKPLSVKVLASTTSYSYQNTGADGTDGTVAVHSDATFTSGEKQLLSGALYPSLEINGQKTYPPVYFSALHPNKPDQSKQWEISETSVDDTKSFKASYTFEGYEDLMFAPQTTGAYSPEGTAEKDKITPTLVFKHILTYIKLHIYAENEDVANAWGEIRSITIRNSSDMGDGSNKAIIDLSTPLPSEYKDLSGCGIVEFQPVPGYVSTFYATGTDEEFLHSGSYSLLQDRQTYVPIEVAYTMMAPVNAILVDKENASIYIPEFEIDITTSNRNITVDVDLMKNTTERYFGSTMGKKFDITLKFTMGNTVAAQAKVTSWLTGGIGVGDFNE